MTELANVISRGATGTRPAAGIPGQLFYDTTLNKWQRDNGSTWDDCPGSAGAAAGAMILISKQVVSVAVATVTFSVISGSYTSLELHYQARTNGGAANQQVLELQFNGDTGTNYDYMAYDNTGGFPVAAASSGALAYIPGGGGAANYAGGGKIFLPNYAATTFYKNYVTLEGLQSGINRAGENSGTWKNTAAITQILLQLDANNFAVGSTFALYGIS